MNAAKHTGSRGGFFRLAVALIACSGACPVAFAQSADPRGEEISALCEAFPDVNTAAMEFAEAFADGSDDLDDDGLPDRASLALVREVACNPDAPVTIEAAALTAFEANLAFFDGEADTTGLEAFREAIAVLMLTNATTEAAVKAAVALADPPITLAADYTQVTCTGGTCMPAPARSGTAGAFFDFEAVPRAADEPFAADGDLDGDGVTNLTEYENIVAQGGTLTSFVIAATSAELDGSEPLRSEGSGCFIATAAFGTPLAEEIDVLRGWRDRSLLTNPAGGAFVDAYYRLSPAVADRVAESDVFAGLVRALLRPAMAVTPWGSGLLALGAASLVVIAAARMRRIRAVTSRARRPHTGRAR